MDHEVEDCPISRVHSDVLQTHILTRLDGPTLAAAGSASPHLRALSSDDSLWRDICHRQWPSSAHPLIRHIITSFPFCHRSFYANSSLTLHRHDTTFRFCRPSPLCDTLISAVDMYYKSKHLLSKVTETNVKSSLRLLNPDERWPIPGKLDFRDLKCESELENNLTLSWILLDRTRTRAANLTTIFPVSVNRDWLTSDVEVRFGTILSRERKRELVECRIVVTCGVWDDGDDLHVKQVRLEVKDVEGKKLGWKESLVILHKAMESGERRRGSRGKDGYEAFRKMGREIRERKRRRGGRWVVTGIWAGLLVVSTCCLFIAICSFHFVFRMLKK